MTDRKWYRWRPFAAAVLVLLVSVAVFVAQATAGSSGPVTVPIRQNISPGLCKAKFDRPYSGTATFTRTGDALGVIVNSRGAYPSTNVFVYLYDADSCSYLAYLGKYKIGADGTGDKTSTDGDVSGYSTFYVCTYYYRADKSSWYYDCSLPASPT
jgi:hypothetical protein